MKPGTSTVPSSLSRPARRAGLAATCSGSAGPTAARQDAAPAVVFARLFDPIAHLLPLVERRLQEELQSPYRGIADLLSHGAQLGGKRLRPALLLLAGSCVKSAVVRDDHVKLAVVLEMVHTATLIHDDVLDGADTRRHFQTANTLWGEHASILLGDYLFAQAFHLAATLGSTDACRWIGEASRRVCEGELRQVFARGDLELDEPSYLEMIRGKTAELCSVACRLGVSLSGGSAESAARLADYGESLGIAFQIADDYLDLWGDDAVVGKTLGTDVIQGKWTLPVLRLLQTASLADAQRIRSILRGPSERRLAALMPLLDQSDARRYTRQVAEMYRDRACDALSDVINSPAKRALLDIATFSISRTF